MHPDGTRLTLLEEAVRWRDRNGEPAAGEERRGIVLSTPRTFRENRRQIGEAKVHAGQTSG
jgi:hypothetical protein